jgi:ribosomal protein S18 acetylase RimI-like enzyme
MYYRSDWPEVGFPAPIGERPPATCSRSEADWAREIKSAAGVFCWAARQNAFESGLYEFPVWDLHLEFDGSPVSLADLQPEVDEQLPQALSNAPWGSAYVASKVVAGEPLYEGLLRAGFEAVEHRRLFGCLIQDLHVSWQPAVDHIRLTSLAAVDAERLTSYQEQILTLSREAFAGGYSRHFSDPILLAKQSGVDYILALMRLNFEHIPLEHFLVAVDAPKDQVCGFSVIGKKPGLGEHVYTQLLSAVRKEYRGLGIYHGLTNLLLQTLPQDAGLLNVTHVENRAIQRAYADSGRVHLADAVVLRRFFTGK